LAALLVGARAPHLQRPHRPRRARRTLLRWARHDLEARDAFRALAVRGADAIATGVPAADDDDVLPGGEDRSSVGNLITRNAPVLLRQEIHRVVGARKLAARHRQITRLARADGEENGVIL